MFRNDDISDGGRPVLLAGPTAAVLTRDEVKRHLRVDHDDDNVLIDGLIGTAVAVLDAPTGGILGRALRPQQWELQLSSFNDRRRSVRPYYNWSALAIPLPYPPLISVDSVKYLSVDGVDTTMIIGTDFRVIGIGAPISRQAIAPPYGKNWPVARIDVASVRIRFTAGYAPAQSNNPDELPELIKSWLKLLIGSLYENRESVSQNKLEDIPEHILQMISQYRVFG